MRAETKRPTENRRPDLNRDWYFARCREVQAAEKALPYMHPRLEMIAAMVDQRSTTDYEIKATLEERLAIAQELFDRAFGLMGKSRLHPQIIEAQAIQAPK